MRWLELLGLVPKDQRNAIRLADTECWRVEPIRDAAAFYRAIISFAESGTVLYLEGSTEKRVPRLLEPRQISDPIPIALGTLWPVSDHYHVAATEGNLRELADLIDAYGIALPAIHTHLYRGRKVLLEWHDAFTDDPMFIAADVPESDVRALAGSLGCNYRLADHTAYYP